MSKTLKYLADVRPHPVLSTFNLQFPTKRENIIQDFEKHIKQLRDSLEATGERKIIAIIDTIASNPGVLLPWKEMVAICREAGVISVVDGAHSIGQELDINLSEARPDFWVSVRPLYLLRITVTMPLFPKNCHKWLFSKRGSAVLYVPKRFDFSDFMISDGLVRETRNQHLIKSTIPTPVTYHSPHDDDYQGPQDFVKLFECA